MTAQVAIRCGWSTVLKLQQKDSASAAFVTRRGWVPFTAKNNARITVGSTTQRAKLLVRAEQEESGSASVKQDITADGAPEEVPAWIRREKERELAQAEGQDLPFFLYLLFSAMVAIAAVGSIYEFANQNPIFGVVQPSNPLYTPILGTFSLTGLPTAGWLFLRAVTAANKEAERMDKSDGYR